MAEQLDRSRDQLVSAVHAEPEDGAVTLRLDGEDLDLARWAAARQRDVFERAFGRRLELR